VHEFRVIAQIKDHGSIPVAMSFGQSLILVVSQLTIFQGPLADSEAARIQDGESGDFGYDTSLFALLITPVTCHK
jgi:hypothetical protein